MKKIINVAMVLCCLCMSMTTALAEVPYTIESMDSEIPGLTQIGDSNYYKYSIQGTEYYVYKDESGSLSRPREYNEAEFNFFIGQLKNGTYTKAGDYYMIGENNISGYQANFTDAWKQAMATLTLYDKSFNIVKEYKTQEHIVDIGYDNGVYSYEVKGFKYVSTDFENWNKVDKPESDWKFWNYNGISYNEKTVSFDGKNYYELNFEMPFAYTNSGCPAYIVRNKTSPKDAYVAFSENDVYYDYLDINDILSEFNSTRGFTTDNIYAIDDYLYIDTHEWYESISATPDDIQSARIKIALSDIDAALAEMSNAPYVVYDNKMLAFEQPPVIENDRTLIPIRFLFEQMGADVEWNQDTQTATISQDNTAISFSIDDKEATVNGQTRTMDVPAQLINDKTMVPIRFLSEELGFDVEWDGDNHIITIE